MKTEIIRNKQIITVEKSDILHAGQHESRIYVIIDQPADKYGRQLCLTRWTDVGGSEWECSHEFTSDEWTGIDDSIANEIINRPFVVKSMIDNY